MRCFILYYILTESLNVQLNRKVGQGVTVRQA